MKVKLTSALKKPWPGLTLALENNPDNAAIEATVLIVPPISLHILPDVCWNTYRISLINTYISDAGTTLWTILLLPLFTSYPALPLQKAWRMP